MHSVLSVGTDEKSKDPSGVFGSPSSLLPPLRVREAAYLRDLTLALLLPGAALRMQWVPPDS